MDDTLDLSILDSGQWSTALAFARRACGLAIAPLPCTSAQLQQLIQFRGRIDRSLRGLEARPTRQQLASFGRDLFTFCIRDDVEQLYGRRPTSHVRLHIHSNRPDLQALPWEYFQEPTQLPGPRRDCSVVRIVPTTGVGPVVPRPVKARLGILFVAADPLETASWPEVKATIERTFAARIPDGFVLSVIEGVSREALQTATARLDYDIVHVSAHGLARNGRGYLALVDRRTSRPAPLGADELGVMLQRRKPRLVILSAPETAARQFGDGFSLVAQALLRAGVPAVVALQWPVAHSTVATFVGALYDKLLEGGDIDGAMGDARIALSMQLASMKGAPLEWGVPILYRRDLASQLLAP